MKINLFNFTASGVDCDVEVSDKLLMQEVRIDILHKVILWQLANRRGGNHSVKGISDIAGSTRKIYKQKGGGRARHGSNRAPQFRGGAIIFGPCTHSHSFKINKKVRKAALRMALSMKYAEGSLFISDKISLEDCKTKSLKDKLSIFANTSVLMIDDVIDQNLKCAVANLKNCDVLPVNGINVIDLLKREKIILTVNSIKAIEERVL